jgi:hypothetical protein
MDCVYSFELFPLVLALKIIYGKMKEERREVFGLYKFEIVYLAP